jgi:two-component system, chemotaxis family, response regulator Rcp1
MKTHTADGPPPVHILLVEDDPADARLTVEALKEGRVPTHLHVAEDGDEAVAFLRREGKHKDAPRPDLILLDLNLPKRSGVEVLREIKADDALKKIPVVVLSTSRAAKDVEESYGLHASCFISKPSDVWQFFEVIKSVEGFWLTTVRLPDAP